VTDGWLSAAQQREIGFPWSERMVERARRSVGATIAAARSALADGIAANLAGGTHHAYADKGSGYCVFNDVAVAARLMQAEWHRMHRALLRVAVIDLDVHQGNGTASIFRDDPTVFTLSLHGAKNFPFRKEVSDLDVELPDGCADDAYLAALDAALGALWRSHRDALPGLVFYLAGADPHEGRPPRPPQAHDAGPGRARPPRAARAARAPHCGGAVDGRRLRARHRGHGGGPGGHAARGDGQLASMEQYGA
jgi:acetoin utilization deacetylase AcuC-like enzyme